MVQNRFKYSEVTPQKKYLDRRSLIAKGLTFSATLGVSLNAWADKKPVSSQWSTTAEPNSYNDITTYNNFYEFGTGKTDPSKYAGKLTTKPWVVEVGGLVEKPGMYTFDDITKNITLEERIYSFRCVEGWSMVIPWLGFSLSDFLKKAEPLSSAKYVAFETLFDQRKCQGNVIIY